MSPNGKQAVLFAFLHAQQCGWLAPSIHLKGLAEKGVYRVAVMEGRIEEKQETFSGTYLMNHGLTPGLKGDFDATAVVLERLDQQPWHLPELAGVAVGEARAGRNLRHCRVEKTASILSDRTGARVQARSFEWEFKRSRSTRPLGQGSSGS